MRNDKRVCSEEHHVRILVGRSRVFWALNGSILNHTQSVRCLAYLFKRVLGEIKRINFWEFALCYVEFSKSRIADWPP